MEDKLPKVLFLQTVNPGVGYYRIYCFAKRLQELGLARTGIFPEFNPNRVDVPRWDRGLFKDSLPILENYVSWADIIICQYIGSVEGLSFVEACKDLKPCYMEVDDLFGGVPHTSRAYDDNMPGSDLDYWATRQLMVSTGVITTTQFLKNQYRKYNDNIHVIPNCIDFSVWDATERKEHEKVRIGWAGGCTHEGDLKLVKDTLYFILDKYKNVEVWINSGPAPSWPKHDRLVLDSTWHTIDKYPAYLKGLSFDIGIAPLLDINFNRAKSNLRYLEYSACQVPTIASNVEPFKNDFCGYTVKNDDDWLTFLEGFIASKNLREEIGSIAYDSVKEKFNLDSITRQYAKLIGDINDGSINPGKYSSPCAQVRPGSANIG